MTEARIRLREEVAEQIKALKDIKTMGEYYGLDLSHPATSAQGSRAVGIHGIPCRCKKNKTVPPCHWVMYLHSLTFFIEYDLAHGKIDETFCTGAD